MAGFANDPHSERDSECPKNFFGLRHYPELIDVERVLTHKRSVEVIAKRSTGNFDSKHLKQIHHYLFQDIFPWAGEFRMVNISKTTSFAPAIHVASALAEALDKLRREGLLHGLPAKAFAARAAFYLGEINAIHPFREGNGRTQREFLRQLGVGAGHPLSWAGFTQQEMVEASIASHVSGDNAGLADILGRAMGTADGPRREAV